MAADVVATAETTTGGGTTHTVNLPTGIVSGNLLVIVGACDGTGDRVGFPVGWTELYGNDNQHGQGAAYRVADGTEGSTISCTTTSTEATQWRVMRITGHHASSAPEAAALASGSDSSPNPPSLNPAGWATEETLWIATASWDDGAQDRTLSSYPTDYADDQWNSSGVPADVHLAIATRTLETASQDPGVFTISNTEQWLAGLIGVRPAAAGGGGRQLLRHPLQRILHNLVR